MNDPFVSKDKLHMHGRKLLLHILLSGLSRRVMPIPYAPIEVHFSIMHTVYDLQLSSSCNDLNDATAGISLFKVIEIVWKFKCLLFYT